VLSITLTNYAVETRYPGVYDEVTKEEYEEALKIVKNCIEWVDKVIESKDIEKNKI